MASIRNTVIVAMMQVGVIIAGVLAAGICHKVWTNNGVAMPIPASLLYGHGLMGFLVPTIWGTGAIVIQLHTNISDEIKTLAFWLGVLFLIALAIFIIYADVTPWLNGMM